MWLSSACSTYFRIWRPSLPHDRAGNFVHSRYSSLFPRSFQTRSYRSWKKEKRRSERKLNVNDSDRVCAAYCLDNQVLISRVQQFFDNEPFTAISAGSEITYRSKELEIHAGDVVHLPLEATSSNTNLCGHAFFFSSGAAVFWGLPFDVRKQLFDQLSKVQNGNSALERKLGMSVDLKDFDHEFEFVVDPRRRQPAFRNDLIQLTTFDDPKQLLAFSYGLAQSVKLLMFEEIIDRLVHRTRYLPDELARDGKIRLSHRNIKRLTGELIAARYSVNLISDILDTPEYFWQNAELENLHLVCAKEIELRERSQVLNSRTDIIQEALVVLNRELSSSSSDRVEKAILFLIAVEVCFELVRFYQISPMS